MLTKQPLPLAHCLVCGVAGRNKRNFLCDRCADPEKIIMTCACGARYEIDRNEPLFTELAKRIDPTLLQIGLAIKAPRCGRCNPESGDEPLVYRIYRVRPPQTN